MRRFRVPFLLALTVTAALTAPVAAHADGTGPTIDNASLYNGGHPCSSTPIPLNQKANLLLQAVGADPAAPQAGEQLTYTFAIWPTADPAAETDLNATESDFGLTTEQQQLDLTDSDYSWRVRLTDVNGTSDWSQTCQFHNDSTAPSLPTITSSNFPTDAKGPYGVPAEFTFDAHGDTDTVAFRWALNGNRSVTTCTTGAFGQIVCPDPSTWSDVVVAAAPGGTATFSVTPTQVGPNTLTIASQDAAGNDSAEASYTFFVPSKLEPAPSIDGTPAIGQTLTATVQDWSPTPTSISYQWLADGTPITGATGLTYLVQPADVGKSISFAETGVRTNIGTTVEVSNALLIQPATFAATPRPTISGTPVVGQVLSALPGAWSPAPTTFAYHWLRNNQPIAGVAATLHAYRLTAVDAGAVMSVRVGGIRTGYTTAIVTSLGTARVLKPLTAASVPTISGVRRYGQVLTAVTGTWGPAPISFSYRWYVGAAAIPGATGVRYAPPAAYIGRAISVVVTGGRAGYQSLARRSGAVIIGPALFTVVATPRIGGPAQRGAVLTASMPTTPAAAGYRYQWRLNNVAIAGQTGSRYVVRATDVDRRISVVVTAIRAGYTSVQRVSAATAAVPGQAYQNCDSLNAVYPHGVARTGVTGDRVRGVLRPFKGIPFFSNTLYSLNPSLDRDKDGIACEQ